MKLKDPRLTLLAGLALALNLDGSAQVHGAGVTNKPVTLVKAQTGTVTTLPPAVVAPGTTSVAPTPLAPIPDPYPGQLNPNAPPVISDPNTVTTVPMQLGAPPSLAPTNRPPMGLHYGEWDQLDAYKNPSPRPLTGANPPGGVPVNPYSPNPGVPATLDGSGAPPMEVVGPYGMTDRFGFAPPPGTLGQTYKRRSRPIEDNKHPRVGAVEVNLPEEVDVTAKGLKVKWTGKVWRLESDSLIPGVPHIYEVKASWGEGTQPQVRTIRLIMGRIVDLEF